MKFSEILGLQDYFHPVFNIQHETENYWKQFIPNEQFYDVLNKTLSAINTSEPNLRKSIWIQGTYGTGKSHAGAVVKHLLWDEWSTISDYVEERVEDSSLKAKIKNYRQQENKLFPVVISGVANIVDHRTFALQIERSIKEALNKAGYSITLKTDFERYIEKAEDETINWSSIIENDSELNIYVKDKSDIVRKLKSFDIEFFRVLESALGKKGLHFSHEQISEWLIDVNQEIKNKKIADGIMIFWDEFTSLMDSLNSGIINQIQSVAELSEKNNIYFYLISHRTPNLYSIDQKEISRMNDRFHIIQYKMEPITTYHIISATIRKLNLPLWNSEKDSTYNRNPSLEDLISDLTNNSGATAKSRVKDLYPIHPYSAYLSTFIARHLGSTNRSIFDFLYNKESGFKYFLENDDVENSNLLTADYLWDFFIKAFEEDSNMRFNVVIDKYKQHIENIRQKGTSYEKVFKGILLLNVLNRVVDASGEESNPVNPSTENIISLFLGTDFELRIHDILDFIDEKGIIGRDPFNQFPIELSSLSVKDLEKEKKGIVDQYKDIVDVLRYKNIIVEIEKSIFKDTLYRENEIEFFSSAIDNEHILRTRLQKVFKKSYSLHIAVFLLKSEQEGHLVRAKIEKLSKDEVFANMIFITVEEPFQEKNYDRFIDYIARKQASDKLNRQEESTTYENNAKQQVQEWVSRIRQRYVILNFKNNEEKHLADSIGGIINKQYSPSIFNKGVDTIPALLNVSTIWDNKSAIKCVEHFLSPSDRNALENNLAKNPYSYLKSIVKDSQGIYIIENNLIIKNEVDTNHPLITIQTEINKKLNELKSRSQFNIGEELIFLTEVPYGIYTNMPNMALMGFVFREYINELYLANLGSPLDETNIRDLIGNLFNYWQNGKNREKLNIRFGSKQERELKKILSELFDLKDFNSITDTRWAIINYSKQKVKYPLWAIKYFTSDTITSQAIDAILSLVFTEAQKIDLAMITSVLDKIKDHKLDLTLTLKPENFKIGFLNFLKKIETVLIVDNDFDSISTFLAENMQEEVGIWDEEKVKNKIYQWYIKKTTPVSNPNENNKNGESNTPSSSGVDKPNELLSTKKEKVIYKVRNYNQGETNLKNIIIGIIEEQPDLAELFDRYMS